METSYPFYFDSQQRNDNNCLSKSKAERYRWCVQQSSNNNSSTTQLKKSNTDNSCHVNSIKKTSQLTTSVNTTASVQVTMVTIITTQVNGKKTIQ